MNLSRASTSYLFSQDCGTVESLGRMVTIHLHRQMTDVFNYVQYILHQHNFYF